ncbi:VanW family protein [Kribbia dieselivorans]|uniref:VanW family protein n=1 Tax=Kribbia dieselivorans TaxID=331526 RepID=UPI0008399A28|nr:VanW family protein [Kribbia dieselivorans]
MNTNDQRGQSQPTPLDETGFGDDADGFWDLAEPTRRGRGLAIAGGVALAIILAALYIVAAGFFGQRVPSNTLVGGVDVGGMTDAEAISALRKALDEESRARITVTSPARKVVVDPVEAGMQIDYEASLAGLTGFSLNPVDIVNHLRGGVRRDIVRDIDDTKLESTVAKALKPLEAAPAEGSVSLKDGKVTVVRSRTGLKPDATATARRVSEVWPGGRSVVAVTTTTQPTLSNDEITRFANEFATPAMNGPLTVKAGTKSFQVAPAALATGITVRDDGKGKLSPEYDDAVITRVVVDAATASGAISPATNAQVRYQGGTRFSVTPSKTGIGIKEASVFEPVKRALLADNRTARVATVKLEPELTTARAKATLPKGEISAFATTLPPNPGRTNNIRIAARTLNGTYVPPGGQLSLNGILGQRTGEKGYSKQPVIYAGRLRMDYGGGISQLSTTLFNAAFFAGVRIDQYTPHSFYIPRYPEGREATISWPDVDQKWTNTTDGGILVRAGVNGDQVHVSFLGVKTFQVSDSKSPRRNVRKPKTITDRSKGCVPQAAAEGFDVTVTRVVKKGGRTVETRDFVTHYIAEDQVNCVGGGDGKGGSSD